MSYSEHPFNGGFSGNTLSYSVTVEERERRGGERKREMEREKWREVEKGREKEGEWERKGERDEIV